MGVIGLGHRGSFLIKSTILGNESIELVAVCDEYEDRVQRAASLVAEKTGKTPFGSTDYRELLSGQRLDAVVISAAWIT